jgi:hypothetical protein
MLLMFVLAKIHSAIADDSPSPYPAHYRKELCAAT